MMENCIYLEMFVIKDGKRYNVKTVSLKHLSNTLTNGMMDAIEELFMCDSARGDDNV